jgi:hypothetical protein
MIKDAELISEQLMRLGGLRGFPHRPELEPAREELLSALTNCLDAKVLEQVVSDWLKEYDYCPKPADLYRVIAEENQKKQPTQKPPPRFSSHCLTCQDTGITESIDANDVNSMASYCSCMEGRKRANLDYDNLSPDRVNKARAKLRTLDARAKKNIPLDRTTRDVKDNETRDRLRHVAEIDPEPPIRIPATHTRTPEENQQIESEMRRELLVDDEYQGDF